jgi:hypothetical protein
VLVQYSRAPTHPFTHPYTHYNNGQSSLDACGRYRCVHVRRRVSQQRPVGVAGWQVQCRHPCAAADEQKYHSCAQRRRRGMSIARGVCRCCRSNSVACGCVRVCLQRPERICQRTLDWGEDELPEWFNHEVIETDGGLDIILAADVVYTEEDGEDDEMTKKLLKTLSLLFSSGRGCAWGESAYDIGPELLMS